jgi:hypothetical protein
MQLQKEKEGIRKHKQLTEEVVRRKMEFNKLAQLVPLPPRRRARTAVASRRRSPICAAATTPTGTPTSRR